MNNYKITLVVLASLKLGVHLYKDIKENNGNPVSIVSSLIVFSFSMWLIINA